MNEYKFTDKNKKQCGYMRIVDEADTDSAELYFYGDICGSQWETYLEDKAPQDVADFLHSLDGKKKAVSEQFFRKRSVIFLHQPIQINIKSHIFQFPCYLELEFRCFGIKNTA